jgi:hypothetical protein
LEILEEPQPMRFDEGEIIPRRAYSNDQNY